MEQYLESVTMEDYISITISVLPIETLTVYKLHDEKRV